MNGIIKLRDVSELARLGLKARGRDSAGNYELFEKLIDMGGVYVKFAQLLLLKLHGDRRHLSHEFSFLLKKAYDTTPFEPINIKALLQRELGNKTAHFSKIEKQPFAAGSFGQVYRATLQDGSVVIVKALRPSVLANIHFDIRLLSMIVKLSSLSSKDTAYDMVGAFSKFRRLTLQELNYPQEADYAHELYLQYKDHHSVVIPKTYKHLCSKHLIVQEYIEGLSLTDVLAQKEFGREPKEYVQETIGSDLSYQMIALGQVMLESLLSQGSAHGDPHPGNIKLLPGNKVALIDFGISAESPHDRQAFFDLIKQYQLIYSGKFNLEGYTWAVMNLFVTDLTTAVRSLDMYNHGRFSEQLFTAISDAAASIYKSSSRDIVHLMDSNKIFKIFNSVINENNRFGFDIKLEQPEFMRATLMFIALVDSLEIKQEVFSAVYTNVVNNFNGVELQDAKGYTNPENAVAIIAEWLEKLAAKDIYLYQMISSKISPRVLNV